MLKAVLVVVAGISLTCPLAYADAGGQAASHTDTQALSSQTASHSNMQASSSQTASEDLPVEDTVDCFYESNKSNDACQGAGANLVAVHSSSSSRITGSH